MPMIKLARVNPRRIRAPAVEVRTVKPPGAGEFELQSNPGISARSEPAAAGAPGRGWAGGGPDAVAFHRPARSQERGALLRAEAGGRAGHGGAAGGEEYRLRNFAGWGSLLVASDKLDAARLETAAQGLPRNARLGFELFDTPNWAGSDFSEKVNYQRALEGELERTLQTLNEVEAVRVHLVLPRESLFSEQERDAKAAVIVKTHGGTLSREAQQAIPQLVASAVDGLRPENVTVVDADTAMSFLPRRGPSGKAAFDSDEELAVAAVHAIEAVVGPEHVRASVHVDYDLSSSEDTSELYDPKATATLAAQHTEELAGGANPAGVPGVASNVPGSTAALTPPPPPAKPATAGAAPATPAPRPQPRPRFRTS